MSHQNHTSICVLAVLVSVASLVLLPAGAQGLEPPSDSWNPPHTAWGAPDLRGIWDFRTITPLERPEELATKKFLSEQEASDFQKHSLETRNKDLRASDGLSAERDVALAYNQFWWDYGDQLTEDRRTSLIVDPPDGRIPPLTPHGQNRSKERRTKRERPAHGPEDRNPAERCILGFNAGPPMNPSAYNNNVQLFQTPGWVVIFNEMVNDARIVPMDGRPHLAADIRQWRGDSRGHWEGNTLVVKTTNFTNKTSFRGSGRDLHLVERFTRVGPDRLLYEYTIDDPKSFSKPWTAAVPMKKTTNPLYEYACHEGNYGMFNLLKGARAEDEANRQAAEKTH